MMTQQILIEMGKLETKLWIEFSGGGPEEFEQVQQILEMLRVISYNANNHQKLMEMLTEFDNKRKVREAGEKMTERCCRIAWVETIGTKGRLSSYRIFRKQWYDNRRDVKHLERIGDSDNLPKLRDWPTSPAIKKKGRYRTLKDKKKA